MASISNFISCPTQIFVSNNILHVHQIGYSLWKFLHPTLQLFPGVEPTEKILLFYTNFLTINKQVVIQIQ